MAAFTAAPDLSNLLEALDPHAGLVQRHVWLNSLLDWVRGNNDTPEAAVARITLLLDVLEARPATLEKMQLWWRALVASVDGSTLLSDYGFASTNAFVSELVERLHFKLLPATPETTDASELFSLLFDGPFDAQWLNLLPDSTLGRLSRLLHVPAQGALAEVRLHG